MARDPEHADLRHPWQVSPPEARRIQEKWRSRVIAADRLGPVRLIAGADARFDEERGVALAAVVVLEMPTLEVRDTALAELPLRFPYIPGLFSFREGPAILEALENLTLRPDLLLCGGHGIAHPRRLGLASHVGVAADLPTIGVARTALTGTHDPVPGPRGSWQPLIDRGEVIGAALRTRAGVRPVFVSVGHRVSLDTAIRTVLTCSPRFRFPEPLRRAHAAASASHSSPLDRAPDERPASGRPVRRGPGRPLRLA